MLKLLLFILVAQVTKTQAVTISENVTFADGPNRFFDLSQFNFKRGLDNVYEYTIRSNNANKIYLYFYTIPAKNAIVEVYDGVDDKAEKIILAFLLPAFYNGSYTYPQAADSSGPNMFVRIRPYDPKATSYYQDFQALVTDFANPEECDPLVLQINNINTTVPSIPFSIRKNSPCNHVIHALDLTNNPWITLNLNLANGADQKLVSYYKGLLTIEDNRITTMSNIWAFDKHIFIHHFTDISITTSVALRTNLQSFVIGDNGVGMFMTQDYLPYVVDISNQYIEELFQIDFSGNVSTVEFLFPQTEFSGANVTVQIFGGETTNVTNYKNTPPTITAYGSKVIIKYQSLQGWGRGLYATFRDVSYQYPLRTPAPISPTDPGKIVNQTITTPMPTETTTKGTNTHSIWKGVLMISSMYLLQLLMF